jgi:pyridoxamine 5'-phosphate oxidase
VAVLWGSVDISVGLRGVWSLATRKSDGKRRGTRGVKEARPALLERDVDPDPIRQFSRWFEEAKDAVLVEPTAMTLSTSMRDGRPSARMVLLKGVDDRGFVFFTNYESRKGRELTDNPHAALTFWWGPLERQVNVTGTVARVSAEESDAYFNSRPVESRIGALASRQSSVLASREDLDRRVAELTAQYKHGGIPRPAYWGGFRLIPEVIEFWQGRANRLHDRLRYTRDDSGWRVERLSP